MQGAAQQSALETVTKNVEKMVDLINNLLVLYEMHLISPEFSDIDLVTLTQEAIREARMVPAARKRQIDLERPSDLPQIRGDRNGLLLAIRSLIENAFKFSQENDLVVVNIYLIAAEAIGIDVIDQGVGVPLETQAHIFDPFYRVEGVGPDRLFSGLGVGLAIAKFIVEQHNGRITVESEPGKGSTFTVRLPLASSE
jgi:signal transduction histidine kinase